jgi:hypothetical protein
MEHTRTALRRHISLLPLLVWAALIGFALILDAQRTEPDPVPHSVEY